MLIAAMSMAATAPALAQTAQNANSGSTSDGQAVINQNSYGSPGVNYSGSYSETIANTPDLGGLYAMTTANCITGGGVGITGPGIGAEAMGGVRDSVCTWEGKVKMAYVTGQSDVAHTEWCLKDPDYRDSEAILNKPCDYRTYPKDQQEQVKKDQIKAGFLNVDGTQKLAVLPQQPKLNPMSIERANFCATLNPAKPEDRPYISQCMNK